MGRACLIRMRDEEKRKILMGMIEREEDRHAE